MSIPMGTKLHPLCLHCSQISHNRHLEQIRRVKKFLLDRGVKKNRTQGMTLLHKTGARDIFSHHIHCEYGVSCGKIQSMQAMINQEAQESLLLLCSWLSEEITCQEKHDILRLLQGYFPKAYHFVERYAVLAEN